MLIGIQGSGKWTQARKILDAYPEYILFEMGTELRKFAKNGTPDGDMVNSILVAGNKVGPEYIFKLSKDYIEKNNNKKILIDGVIRDSHQNETMESVLWDFDVLWLDLDEETAVKRLSGRRIDPVTSETFPSEFQGETNPKTGNTLITRTDDTPEAIRKRIAWSISDTLPLIEVWKRHGHTIYHIDASEWEDEIFAQIEKILRNDRK